jgi:hypothetical protein
MTKYLGHRVLNTQILHRTGVICAALSLGGCACYCSDRRPSDQVTPSAAIMAPSYLPKGEISEAIPRPRRLLPPDSSVFQSKPTSAHILDRYLD